MLRARSPIPVGWLVAMLVVPGLAAGQTVSPIIAEYRQDEARGQLRVINPTLYPINVVLEPLSFSVDREGRPKFRPLVAELAVRLSSTSFRVGPRETYLVSYEAKSRQLPAWFTIYATIAKAGPTTGLQLAFRLPHTVYLLGKRSLVADSVALLGARSIPSDSGGRIEAEVENRGGAAGRVKEVEVRSASERQTYPGFPLFPRSQRLLRLDWRHAEPPERIVFRFDRFEVEHAIAGDTGPP